MSWYCLAEAHNECDGIECVCDCHDKEETMGIGLSGRLKRRAPEFPFVVDLRWRNAKDSMTTFCYTDTRGTREMVAEALIAAGWKLDVSCELLCAPEPSQPLLPDETVEVPGTRTLARWITEKAIWEQAYFGTDMRALEGEEFADALRTHCLALQVEVGELLKEVPWKTWAVKQGRPDEEHWRRALVEYADMMMFMANIALILRFTGTDIDQALDKKFAIITDRQASGSYTGISEKCAECGR